MQSGASSQHPGRLQLFSCRVIGGFPEGLIKTLKLFGNTQVQAPVYFPFWETLSMEEIHCTKLPPTLLEIAPKL
jgi:hypothetical protein